MKVEYLNGTGNKYVINNEDNFVEYIPIKKDYSSSGFYDGGEYIKKEINKSQFNKIMSIFKVLEGKKEVHIQNRVKKSGMIIIKDKHEVSTFIIAPDTAELNEVEKLLQDFIKNK